MTKICKKCGTEKAISEFSINAGRKDGLRDRCKVCDRKDYQAYYAAHKVKVLSSGKEYRHANKAAASERQRLKRAEHEKQYAARRAINNAIASGAIRPEPCFLCGSKAEAHHASYCDDMRLSVTWLCRAHHRDLHREAFK